MDRIRRLNDQGDELAELPVEVSAGAPDAGKVAVLASDGKFDVSMIPAQMFTYVHDQAVPSDTWVVVHDLGRFPGVTVVDSANEVWRADVQYDSPNQLTIRHAAPFSGKAYLN